MAIQENPIETIRETPVWNIGNPMPIPCLPRAGPATAHNPKKEYETTSLGVLRGPGAGLRNLHS